MTSYVRTRGGRMIHRVHGCPSANPLHTTRWSWAAGMGFETLITEFVATVGSDPQAQLCGHCFGRNERAAWFSRVQHPKAARP
jgi:hypothetical protein